MTNIRRVSKQTFIVHLSLYTRENKKVELLRKFGIDGVSKTLFEKRIEECCNAFRINPAKFPSDCVCAFEVSRKVGINSLCGLIFFEIL